MILKLETILRSTVFNLIFYGLNACACILCIPFLFMPRRAVMRLVKTYVTCISILERLILNLRYEVIGQGHLPTEGSYIVAAKHQSPYETLKLHLLFDDPAIILKQELLSIPIWGKFLARINPIAINRKSGKEAVKQVVEGAQRVKAEGRPIVIFPQGTRVYPWETTDEKPYKSGLVRMYEATDLPIVPLALNTGMFWPRRGWLKATGTVTFEFLPQIKPGLSADKVGADVQKHLEDRSIALQEKALSNDKSTEIIFNPPQTKQQAQT